MVSFIPVIFFRLLCVMILFSTATALLEDYHCGIGSVSKFLSYVSSGPCGREKLNQCCYNHDLCYDRFYNATRVSRDYRNCDAAFEGCIERSYSGKWLCKRYLTFTHGGIVGLFGSLYTDVFGTGPPVEHGHASDVHSNGTGRWSRTSNRTMAVGT